MNIYAEIRNPSSIAYWKRGIFVLRNVNDIYYWYPYYLLPMNATLSSCADLCNLNIFSVLEKCDEQACKVEKLEYTDGMFSYGYGYKVESGDLP